MAKFTDFTFKRVISRPNNIDLNKVQSCRKLFAIRFTQEIITTNTLIININESAINRNLKVCYSWRHKGVSIECKNISFIKSISLMIWIVQTVPGLAFLF